RSDRDWSSDVCSSDLASAEAAQSADGSIMIVVATDAPIDHRNLNRLAARAMMGLARTGSSGSNGSGDFVIAFSTARELRTQPNRSEERRVGKGRRDLE